MRIILTISLIFWILDCYKFCLAMTFLGTFLIRMRGWNGSSMSELFLIAYIWRPLSLLIFYWFRSVDNFLSWNWGLYLIIYSIIINQIIIIIEVSIISINHKLINIDLSIWRWLHILQTSTIILNRPLILFWFQILHLYHMIVSVSLHAFSHISSLFPLFLMTTCSWEILSCFVLPCSVHSLWLTWDTIGYFNRSPTTFCTQLSSASSFLYLPCPLSPCQSWTTTLYKRWHLTRPFHHWLLLRLKWLLHCFPVLILLRVLTRWHILLLWAVYIGVHFLWWWHLLGPDVG